MTARRSFILSLGVAVWAFLLCALYGCAIRKELVEVSCKNQKARIAVPPVVAYKGNLIFYDDNGVLRIEENKDCGVK